MKIIGTSNDTCILEATHDEVARIMGFYSKYNMNKTNDLKAGLEVPVSPIYDALREVAHIKGTIEEATKRHQSLLSALGKLATTINPVSQKLAEQIK